MQLRYGLPAELVVARGIPFRTVCEHHLLPFPGLAHGGYLPGERIIGLSKLARPVERLAAGPQAHERLTTRQSRATNLQAKPGPRTRDFTSARHDEKRLADQVNIDSWRSG